MEKTGAYLIRERLGLTLQEMAAYLGISVSLLSMSENRKRTLPTEVVFKLAD